MASKRHGRLSNAALAAKPPQKKRSSLVRRAQGVAISISKSREEVKRQRANHILEKREIEKFTAAAERHVPSAAELLAMSTEEKDRLILTACYAALLRSACTSRREIESMVTTIIKKLKSGDIFDDATAIEQTQDRICQFLLGGHGTPMVDTISPRVFSETKALRRLFHTVWKDDATYSAYESLTVDMKSAWAFVMRLRQRMTDKLNRSIYALFKRDTQSSKSPYETAVNKVFTKMLAEYSLDSNHETLPEQYVLESLFAVNVVIEIGLDDILRDWASLYGNDLPKSQGGSVENGLIGMLNTRAEYKGCPSMNLYFRDFYEKLKKIRCVTEDDVLKGVFPYSQKHLELSEDEINEATTGGSKVLDLTQTESEPEKLEENHPPPLPTSQKRSWLASFEDSSDELEELIEDIQPKKSEILEKPTLPYMKKRRRVEEVESRKKAKTKDLEDGLPPLEALD